MSGQALFLQFFIQERALASLSITGNMKNLPILFLLVLLTVAMAAAAVQPWADTRIAENRPVLTTAADLFNTSGRPTEPWSGFDPARYKDMSFYKKDGIAHLRGRIIGYTPDSEVKTAKLRAYNCIKGDWVKDVWQMGSCEINPDGTFSIDIPIAYPQYDFFELGEIGKYLFLIPGDTLSIVTTIEDVRGENGSEPLYFGYEGAIGDAVAVNLLADSICEHFGRDYIRTLADIGNDDSLVARTYAANEKIAVHIDSVIDAIPALLADMPVSGFVKDILSITAIGEAAEISENLWHNLFYAKRDSLLPSRQLAPHKKHLDLLYDNPLMLCKGIILPNCWAYSGIFGKLLSSAMFMTGRPEEMAAHINKERLDSLGVGYGFAAQFANVSKTVSVMKNPLMHEMARQQENRAAWITALLKNSDYDVFDRELMASYNEYIRQVTIHENSLATKASVDIDPSAYGGVLELLIAPYRGNVLFLDFWTKGCGSCRLGMMKQKSMLTDYSDKPFRALYIAPAEDMDVCKKWLEKEDIKGEHIFLSADDWTRLQTLFNFGAVPYGVIVDKNGKVIHTACSMPSQRKLIDQALSDK